MTHIVKPLPLRKHVLAHCATLALAVSLAACGGSSGDAIPPPPPLPPPAPVDPVPPAPIPPSPYPGHTYRLPTERPFISLDAFNAPNRDAQAYARLKVEVDDVVKVTRLPSHIGLDGYYAVLNVNHANYSVADSVLMFRLTGEEQYIRQALGFMSLFLGSELRKISAGVAPAIAADSYRDAGRILEQIALVYDYGYPYFFFGGGGQYAAYANQTIYNVRNPQQAQWGGVSHPWSGWDAADPGSPDYHAFMKATMLWTLASQDAALLEQLQQQTFTQLVPYLSQLQGGGLRSGTGYGTTLGSLFENYRYWKSSTGEDLAALSTHARDTIEYWIHATVPTWDYHAPIGDQPRSPMPRTGDLHRQLVAEAVALKPDAPSAQRGTWWLNRIKVTDGANGSVTGRMRHNSNFRYDLLAPSPSERAPTALVYDARGVGALFARSDWSGDASWMALVAGAYDHAHAHQDQGSISLYKGEWLAATSNIHSLSGNNQGVALHNVVRFEANGEAIGQNHAISGKTVNNTADTLQVIANLTPVYASNAARVSRWVRTLTYRRSVHTWQVRDQCSVAADVRPVWQLHVPSMPVLQPDGSILAGKLLIKPVLPAAPEIALVDMRAASSEFTGGYRVELRAASGCDYLVELRAL